MRYIERDRAVTLNFSLQPHLRYKIDSVVEAAKQNELIRSELYEIASEVNKTAEPLLQKLFLRKCAYCESRINQAYSNIDRFRPLFGAKRDANRIDQAHYCWLVAEWENLYLCCPQCSTYKGSLFPIQGASWFGRALGQLRREEDAQLIDPCWDRPEQHLEILYDGVLRGRTGPGRTTIEVLNLNRHELCERRWDILRTFHGLWSHAIELAYSLPEGSSAVMLEEMLQHDAEHVGTIYMYLTQSMEAPQRRLLDRIIVSGMYQNAFIPLMRGIGRLPALDQLSTPTDHEDPTTAARDLEEYRPVKSLAISNFKGIEKLVIEFPLTSKKEGQALAIVGQNSAGKSSVLQALALGLIGPAAANKVVGNADRLLRKGAAEGWIEVEFWGTEARNVISISKYSRHFNGVAQRPTRVFGYGPYRLLAKRPLKPGKRGTQYRLNSLFKDGERLNGFHEWIGKLNQRQRHDLAESLQQLLAAPNTKVTVEGNSILIRTNGRLHPIDALSSGMQSMVSMCTDFAEPLYADSDSALRGSSVILVDELDAHLHPAWRIGIVGRLGRAFPNAHLIFSTHDPLTLRGLDAEQIQILYGSNSGAVKVKRADWYSDSLDIDQILTSDIFGLQDTHLPDWQDKVHEYHALLLKEDSQVRLQPAEAARLDALRTELKDLGLLGRTKRERLVYAVIDQMLAHNEEPLEEWDPAAIDRLSELVQARIQAGSGAEGTL
jgi:uncharacterized protein (TIGR02646 family)